MASLIGCGATSFPLRYLGVLVGCSKARCSNWNAITQSFASKLALWKACLLSIGGRLSLIKSVLGHLPTYYMSIYPMPVSILKKLESMRNQFFLRGDSDEKKMSWVRWNRCLASKDLGGLDGASTSFWEDTWCGDHALKSLFPRIYMLDTDRQCMVKNRVPFQDLCSNLRRHSRGGIETIQLSDLQARIEHVVLSEQSDSWR
ncbi:hypothetical protein Tco_1422832 [Tanacetum coccineum]